jgi:hypothetical protein
MSLLHAGPDVRSPEPFRKITLLRVVDSEMKASSSSPEMYELPFEISTLPEADWVQAFRQAYEESARAPRRVVRLTGKRITVTLQVGEDQQRIADDLKDIVEKANVRCWAAWQREEEEEAGRLEELRAVDARLQRLQSEAKQITL